MVAQCYVEGVSTRKVDDIARAMGISGISRSQVSRMAAELDELVEEWRNRPLTDGPYPFVWMDALEVKVREGGRVVGTSALIATAVNADGRREIVGLRVGASDIGASWTAFLRDPVARGLEGVRLVTSDAHEGLKDAIASVLEGAQWHHPRVSGIPAHGQPRDCLHVRGNGRDPHPGSWTGSDRDRSGRS